ncbi:MAG: WG repeat-containing protein [Candidatus Obscuribacterales bacterium]|nr:WG repeat-containing protein [Candidatus Obscuribacterales bacterium]
MQFYRFPSHQVLAICLLGIALFGLSSCRGSSTHCRSIERPVYRGEWGFIDQTGAVVIKPQFNSEAKFKDGLVNASFTADGKDFMTIVDRKGVPITSLRLKKTLEMLNDVAVVETLDKSDKPKEVDLPTQTYINRDGTIMPCRFRECGNFSNGVAVASLPIGPIDFPMGEKMFDEKGYIGNYVLIGRRGNILKKLPGGAVRLNFSEGLIPLKVKTKTGYMDRKGEVAIPPKFWAAADFKEGLACVCMTNGGKWGFINHSGDLVLPCIFDGPSEFNEGLAKVDKGSESGFIDETGAFVLREKDWKCWGNFSDGLAAVHLNKPFSGGFIDKSGKVVIKLKPPIYLGDDFHEGLCKTNFYENNRGTFGYINRSGDWQIKPQFIECSDFSEGLAAVCFHKQ